MNGESAVADQVRVQRCRNCGADAPDAFCPVCGQETVLRLPTFRAFMRDATGRLIGYDGKLWRTLGALFFRPGFLTREYLAGRRRRYVRPARLFLVSSLLLFAALRIVAELNDFDPIKFDDDKVAAAPGTPAAKSKEKDFSIDIDDADEFRIDLGPMTPVRDVLKKRIVHFNSLPRAEKVSQAMAGVFRYGPYAMFALLPAFALLLKVLYLGRRKRHPNRPRLYGEHLMFGAHNHAFAAIAIIAIVAVPNGVVRGALGVWLFVYLLWSMRAVYGGSWLGIFARASVLSVAYVMLFSLAVAGLLIAAVLLA